MPPRPRPPPRCPPPPPPAAPAPRCPFCCVCWPCCCGGFCADSPRARLSPIESVQNNLFFMSARSGGPESPPYVLSAICCRLRLAPRVVAHAQRLHRIEILTWLDRARSSIVARLRDVYVHRILAVVVRFAVGVRGFS